MRQTILNKRLMKEYYEIRLDPPPNCSAWPMKISETASSVKSKKSSDHKSSSGTDDEDSALDLTEWEGYVKGIDGTPYEGGIFRLRISFSIDYPFKPPYVRFITKIYHCNINRKGNICLDLLKDNWSPSLTTAKLLLSISQLLLDPNAKDPLVQSIALELTNRKEEHDRKAREWTRKFAQQQQQTHESNESLELERKEALPKNKEE